MRIRRTETKTGTPRSIDQTEKNPDSPRETGILEEWTLRDRGIISSKACDAAIAKYKARNDLHHLNRIVPQDYAQLEARAENCVNNIFIIESEIFAYHIDEGKIVPQNPDYWTFTSSDTVGVFLRKL